MYMQCTVCTFPSHNHGLAYRMWQRLKTICSSGNNSSAEVRADPLLAEELNTFYGRFECNGGTTLPISAPGSSRQSSDHVFTLSEDEVRRELRRVNVRKAAGPDRITGVRPHTWVR